MTLPFRLAWREMRGGLAGFRIFLVCLALGVASIAAIGAVRMAVQAGLSAEATTLLGGDAEMRFTYRRANDAEWDFMRNRADQVSEIFDFRSMVISPAEERGLVQVKAVDSLYPLYGVVGLEPAMERICAEAEALVDEGYSFIILSDRAVSAERAPVPSLLSCAGVQHHLIREQKRTRCALIIETAEARVKRLVDIGEGPVEKGEIRITGRGK